MDEKQLSNQYNSPMGFLGGPLYRIILATTR